MTILALLMVIRPTTKVPILISTRVVGQRVVHQSLLFRFALPKVVPMLIRKFVLKEEDQLDTVLTSLGNDIPDDRKHKFGYVSMVFVRIECMYDSKEIIYYIDRSRHS